MIATVFVKSPRAKSFLVNVLYVQVVVCFRTWTYEHDCIKLQVLVRLIHPLYIQQSPSPSSFYYYVLIRTTTNTFTRTIDHLFFGGNLAEEREVLVGVS